VKKLNQSLLFTFLLAFLSIPLFAATPSLPAGGKMVTYDDKLAMIAQLDPTFAGLVFEDGNLTVVRTTAADLGLTTLRSAITSVLGDPRLRTAPMKVRKGQYNFLQLYDWSKSLTKIFDLDGVYSFDIDEAQNRLRIGVQDEGVRQPLEKRLLDLGIPLEAVVLEKIERPVFAATLQDNFRMIIGGLHIDYPVSYCTLGFNTIYNGQPAFATNGHCSNNWGVGNDQTPFWQNTRYDTSEYIGNEVAESMVFSNATDSRCPTSANQCKWSDLSFGSYISSYQTQQSYGHIARPIQRTQWGGSVTIASPNFSIMITNEALFPFQGDTVDKVGRTTGWTYGQVTGTCQTGGVYDANSGKTYYLVCYHTANAGVGGGDSGSAVFYYDAVNGTATMTGQLFGSSGSTTFLFSPLNNMQSEFGNIVTTAYGW
jgi:hypothetical protein